MQPSIGAADGGSERARFRRWARCSTSQAMVPMQVSYDALSCDPARLADVLGALGKTGDRRAIRPAAAKARRCDQPGMGGRASWLSGPDTAAARPSSAP